MNTIFNIIHFFHTIIMSFAIVITGIMLMFTRVPGTLKTISKIAKPVWNKIKEKENPSIYFIKRDCASVNINLKAYKVDYCRYKV